MACIAELKSEAQHIVAVADATKHTATIKRFAMQIDNVALIESVYRTIEVVQTEMMRTCAKQVRIFFNLRGKCLINQTVYIHSLNCIHIILEAGNCNCLC